MIFDRFRRKKPDVEEEELQGGYAPLMNDAPNRSAAAYVPKRAVSAEKESAQSVLRTVPSRRHVVELCEEIIDSTRELENARNEYRQITSQLNDISVIEGLSGEDKENICDSVRQIQKLDAARNELLESEKKITDTQFAQIQEEEDSLPNSVRRLKSNEAYLDAIKRDINFLEGEKVEWSILRQECEHEQVILRRIAFFLIAFFSLMILILLIIRLYMDYDIQLFLLIAAFITTLIGVYVLVKYQDCTKEIKRCDVNHNQAIVLQNRVKMKYVNIKNAVDYTCDKYHVQNSYELSYMYEQYQSSVKEKEKFKQTSDDLSYYNDHLVELLDQLDLTDTSYWVHCMSALVNEKELQSQKTELVERKRRLKQSIEENMRSIDEMKREITESTRYMGEVSAQINHILQKIDEINQPL
jgi:hypothetical protein